MSIQRNFLVFCTSYKYNIIKDMQKYMTFVWFAQKGLVFQIRNLLYILFGDLDV